MQSVSLGITIFFNFLGKKGQVFALFSWPLATSDVNTECLCSFWSSRFGKGIDLFLVAFSVGALLLNMKILAMTLCELLTSFCNLPGLSFINIPSTPLYLEYNVPLLFLFSDFSCQHELQYRQVSSDITNTFFYLKGQAGAKERMNLLSTF